MSEADEIWSLDEHLKHSRVALEAILSDPRSSAAQPICHHFAEIDPIDVITESSVAKYGVFEQPARDLGCEFLSDRLEAWETARPNDVWAGERAKSFLQTAPAFGLIYLGWTWEPREGRAVGASPVSVLNNRTAD